MFGAKRGKRLGEASHFPPFLSLIHILPICLDSAQVLYIYVVFIRTVLQYKYSLYMYLRGKCTEKYTIYITMTNITCFFIYLFIYLFRWWVQMNFILDFSLLIKLQVNICAYIIFGLVIMCFRKVLELEILNVVIICLITSK